MRIGVTGAFGFLGASFVAELLERGGWEIVAFASRRTSNPLFDPGRVEVRALDVRDRAAAARAFRGLDAVAHFAGKIGYRAAERAPVWEASVLGTASVLEAALEAGLGRLLYASSISVLGEPEPGRLADESGSPYGSPAYPISFASPAEALAAVDASLAGDRSFLARSRSPYLDAKLASWELAKRYAAERGLPLVTLFPGTAVGPGDLGRSISALVDSVWEGRLGLALGGASSFVDSRDFARGAALALERGRPGEAYVISGRDEHNLGYAGFMDLVSRTARARGGRGIGRPLVLPRAAAEVAGALAERLAPGSGLSRGLAAAGSARNLCSSAKARSELGYEPAPELGPAIEACRRFSRSLVPGAAPWDPADRG